MEPKLMEAILESPVIAAVKDENGLQNAMNNENIRVVFILFGDICSIGGLVSRVHETGRFALVHVDLITGLASKEVAVDFIRRTTEADGIISTRQSFIRRAKELGLAAILRVFLLDSISLESLEKMDPNLPDCLDILPGTMPKILRRVCGMSRVPVLTGGLIADKDDVMAALEAGATAISTTNQKVWSM
ncbi:MAG: glycerol-3-phosphate responsive antiterminator [Faecalibacterium sp.]